MVGVVEVGKVVVVSGVGVVEAGVLDSSFRVVPLGPSVGVQRGNGHRLDMMKPRSSRSERVEVSDHEPTLCGKGGSR